MIELLSLVVAGAIAGGLYAIMASGLVLTYRASGVFNLGYGAVAFAAALAYHVLNQPEAEGGLGLPIAVSGFLAIGVVAPLLGLFLDAAIFRRLARASEAAKLVGGIGVLVALPAFCLLLIELVNDVFGTDLPTAAGQAGTSPPGLGPVPATSYLLTDGVAVTSDQLAVVVAAGAVAAGLWYLLRHTRLGLETRAGVDRPVLARLRGIDIDRSSRIVWALSASLAGLAGVLIAPMFDLSALTFNMIVFASFTAAVAALLRSIPLTFMAGIGLGVVQNVVNGYAPDVLADVSGFRTSVPFLLLFLLLFLIPTRGRDAGSVAEETPVEDPRADLGPWRRRAPWLVAGALLTTYGLFVADAYWAGILNRGLVLGIVFLSFVVVTGYGGMISLAQATFVTVGGFTAGWMVNHQWATTMPIVMNNGRLTFWAATLVAVGATTLVGLFVALPSLRLGGLALAIATLALAFVGDRLVFQLESVRNGSGGWSLPRPAYGPVDLGDDQTLMVVLLVLLVAVVGIVGNLQRSATGRAVLALRSSPAAADTSGIDPMRTKLTLFAVSAALAGLGGALFALVNSPMTNTSAPPLLGIVWLAVAVTFGIRRPGGAVVAGMVYAVVPPVLGGIGGTWGAPWDSLPDTARDLLGSPDFAAMLFGLGAVGLARQPDGVLAEVGHSLRALRDRRAGPAPAREERPADTDTDTDAEGTGPTVARPARPAPSPVTAGGGTDGDRALELHRVRAGYGDVEVLHGVSLAVDEGEVVAVLGANGAGKSTLCAAAAGLVAVTEGEVRLGGVDVTDLPTHRRARQGLVLAPEARGIFPGLTVEDNLTIRLRSGAARQAAKDRFPILGERAHQVAGLLSGGEQQQLALAVALPDPPAVFLADEPTLGLAPLATRTVMEGLAELRDLGTAVVLVEEQAAAGLELADRVALVELGRIGWEGPPAELDLDRLTASYLGEDVAAPTP
ncbi:ATP-binding cassette domain-containing protein [Iamia majanohamensis]|uniref:ATP-binding cassette domain-containing protein n=1 Tax=Iamia majanohamensis TaxID=467976 RepID=A0AAE9Y968_9ACTN|nr:ATP-binding cassette domain-containing protein [Iamia majanohamensis]WCO68071.1 ATP-binding cassette domain-containing protein [Iamia majanohamensis]